MPSTYTSSLSFEKQANGENSGTWGTKMNTVIDLIEQAIAGVVDVAHDDAASYTLTSTQGASNEARNMVIQITGALTAARNVIVPTADKLYVVKNATTGGYAVTVKTSGGTGISVANGETEILYCDATNVVRAQTTPTGTGAPVRATSPTLVTPVLGVATATSVNKVALTEPATGSTLTIADGKTLTASASLTLAGTDGKTLTVSKNLAFDGTDGTTMTFPAESASVGFRNIPQQSKSAAYTTVLGDSGKHIYHPASDNNARTFTIDSNANVAYPIGTAITFVNMVNTLTIAITSDTMYLAGSAGTTGSRTLAAYGTATALKVDTTTWIISGIGLS